MTDLASIGGILTIGLALLVLVMAGVRHSRAGAAVAESPSAAPVPPAAPPSAAPVAERIVGTAPPETMPAASAEPASKAEATSTASASPDREPADVPADAEPASATRAEEGGASPNEGIAPTPLEPVGAAEHSAQGRRRVLGIAIGLVLAGLAVRLQAGLWASPGDLMPFWWLLGVGLLFGGIVGMTLPSRLLDGPDLAACERGQPAGTGVNRDVLLAFGAAVAVEALCIGLFWSGRLLSIAWLAHLLACTLFLSGLWMMSGLRLRSLTRALPRLDFVILAVLLVLAFAVRIWHDDIVPEGIWFDEGQRGLEALHILADRTFRPVFAPDFIQEPVGLWYLIAPLVAVWGRQVMALRLPVVIAGTLGVGAIYLLALTLYGRRVAVVAGGLAVGFVWHLNFSRIALPAVPSLTCDTLAMLCFMPGLRRNSRVLLGLAGFITAAGLYFYFISQLVPLVLTAVGLHHFIAGRDAFVKRNLAGFGLFILGFLITIGPVAQYALKDPAQFSARARTVTVTNEIQQSGSWTPLVNNVRAHLLMLNVKGDANGRHNWSGRPMLDPVTGGLAVVGLALALTRIRRPEWFLPVVWLPIAVAGGVLSISFEAPQSHRSFDAVVPVLLLAALPIGVLWSEIDRIVGAFGAVGVRFDGIWPPLSRLRGSPGWSGGVGRPPLVLTAGMVVLVLAGTNVMNVARYFGQQQADSRTWLEMSSAQTVAGRQIAALPAGMKVYLEPLWVGFPSINFLVDQPHQIAPFDPAVNLPVTDDAAAIFIADRRGVADQIATLYPTAQRTDTRMPDGRTVAGYGFVLSEATLQANRGVAVRYQSGSSTIDRREPALDLDWRSGAPVPAPFDATITLTLTVPTFGQYQLMLEGPPTLRLTLDGVDVLTGGEGVGLLLARGNHALRVGGTGLGSEPIRLLWAAQNEPARPIPARFLNVSPVETTGLLGRIYAGDAPSGEPAVQQVDPNVELRVHILPLPRPYTIEWSGALRVERAGLYHFGVGSVGTSTISIDGVQLAQNAAVNGYADGEAQLERGWHDIRVRFVDRENFSTVTAFWQPPGGSREPIPTGVLRPWPAFRAPLARLQDADLPAPSGPVGDDVAPRLTPVAAPEQPARSAPLADLGALGAGVLGQPRGIASGTDGTLYVADAGRKAVVRFAPDGSSKLLGEGALKEPSAVAVIPDGTVFVLDAGSGELHRLEPDGKLGPRLFDTFPLYGPRGLSATSDGRLILADTGNNRLLIGPPDGPPESITGLSQPTGAVLLGDGTILVADTAANRVVQIGADGKRIASWTIPASTTIAGPQAAALPDGGWAVSDPDARIVLVRRGDGGQAELHPVPAAVRRPTGLAADAGGRLVVSDSEGSALRVVALP